MHKEDSGIVIGAALIMLALSVLLSSCASRAFQSHQLRLPDGRVVLFTEYRSTGNSAVQTSLTTMWMCSVTEVEGLSPTESPTDQCLPLEMVQAHGESVAAKAIMGPATAATAGAAFVGGLAVLRPARYNAQNSENTTIQGSAATAEGGEGHGGSASATGGSGTANATGGVNRNNTNATATGGQGGQGGHGGGGGSGGSVESASDIRVSPRIITEQESTTVVRPVVKPAPRKPGPRKQ